MTERRTVRLQVSGISCAACAGLIEGAARRLDPEADVAVDLATGRVQAETVTPPQDLVAALAEAGYQATPML